MKMVFIQNYSYANHFSFGIMYISAVLKKNGHSTDVFIEGFHKDIVRDICEAKPDIVGFSCMTPDYRWARKRTAEIKKRLNVPIIMGGPHPTYFPEIIETDDNIDIIARGEAENSVLELISRLQAKKEINDIPGLWVKQGGKIYKNAMAPLIEDINEIPFPDRNIYAKYNFSRQLTRLPVIFSRGCYFNCTFCYNSARKKLYAGQKPVRIRSVDNAISEIKQILREHPHTESLIFEDDNLGVDDNRGLDWLNEFCEKYKEIEGPPFIAYLRADLINEERVKKLKKANCYCIFMGVESGNAAMRMKILQKYIPDEAYLRAARLLKAGGIKIKTSNILFLPGETIKMAFETARLNKRMKVDIPWAFTLKPYPGTQIYQYALENGFLAQNFSFDDCEANFFDKLDSPIAPQLRDGGKIRVLHRLFYYTVKIPLFIHLVKILVYCPNNFIFDFLYRLSYYIIVFATYYPVNHFSPWVFARNAFKGSMRPIKTKDNK